MEVNLLVGYIKVIQVIEKNNENVKGEKEKSFMSNVKKISV